jgi:hypothetical protein
MLEHIPNLMLEHIPCLTVTVCSAVIGRWLAGQIGQESHTQLNTLTDGIMQCEDVCDDPHRSTYVQNDTARQWMYGPA